MSKLGLVLSGGGAKGCYQVGAIKALEELNVKPDIVCGVSTGNLQAVMVAQNKYKELYELWDNIKERDILKKSDSLFSIGWKYFFRKFGTKVPSSIYDFSPLRSLIEKNITYKFNIPFRCGVTQLESGLYYSITENHDLLKDFIYASAVMPGYGKPVEIKGRHYIDGGVRNITPFKEAVDFGCDEIIIVLCSPLGINQWEYSSSIVDIAERSLSIILNEIYNEDLSYMGFLNMYSDELRGVRKIKCTVIAPQKEPIGTLEFNQDKIQIGIDVGYSDTMKKMGQ